MKEGFLVHHPLTAKGLHQGQGGVEPGRDGEVGQVQHQVEERDVSGTGTNEASVREISTSNIFVSGVIDSAAFRDLI